MSSHCCENTTTCCCHDYYYNYHYNYIVFLRHHRIDLCPSVCAWVCVCVCVSLSSITCAQTHTHTLKHFYIAGGMQQSVTAYWTYNYLSLAHSITHGMQSRDVWQKYVHTRNAQATHIVDWCICWSTHTHTVVWEKTQDTVVAVVIMTFLRFFFFMCKLFLLMDTNTRFLHYINFLFSTQAGRNEGN